VAALTDRVRFFQEESFLMSRLGFYLGASHEETHIQADVGYPYVWDIRRAPRV
jgi:hypothetical protein